MSQMKTSTKIVAGIAALAAFALGGAALATADGGTPAAPATASESKEAATETAGDQSPSYSASITVPEQDGVSEQAEAAALAAKATVTPAQATDAALAAVPGTAGKAELDNENGSLVYSVEVTKADGTSADVVVDAGNAKVLAKDADAGEADEKGGAEGSETPDARGAAEAPEAPAAATQP